MKNYNLKFGLQYTGNIWHIIKKYSKHNGEFLASDCNDAIWMGHSSETYTHYIYQIKNPIDVGCVIDTQLSYKNLCCKCRNKYNLTQEDINHYIVLAKFKVKI